jgi:murein L,D-transpeptidase YafK
MKTAVLLSAVAIGGHLLTHNFSPKTKTETTNFSAYKTSKARKSSSMPVSPIRIVVDKSSYELYVYDAKGWYATYPVVFGNRSLDDKKMEGDRKTPEGTFHIAAKKYHNKWSRFMALDYPTRQDLQKFEERKRRGEIPANATPGGAIGIHGTWPHEDFVVDRYNNWTNGCISLKREDVEELYNYVPVGTPITIRK